MPTLEKNRNMWSQYHWSKDGDEWSEPWGSTDLEWEYTVLPRIHGFLPQPTILEIAPGYGRWTQFLLGFCNRFYGVDMEERCVARCQQRFRLRTHASFHLNDGRSLLAIPDNCIDFVFSFDSLVHAEADVIEDYLQELARKLAIGGTAFIHHSNLGAYVSNGKLTISHTHRRAPSVTAELFAEMCAKAGL